MMRLVVYLIIIWLHFLSKITRSLSDLSMFMSFIVGGGVMSSVQSPGLLHFLPRTRTAGG